MADAHAGKALANEGYIAARKLRDETWPSGGEIAEKQL